MIALADTIAAPKPGQKTDEAPTSRWGIFGAGFVPAPGIIESTGVASVASVWPGWGSSLWGSYGTYRTMCRHPTIAYVLSQVLGPVLGGTWLVDADEDAPDDAKQWVTDNIIAHRGAMIAHACRAVIFGNAPFEVVWDAQFTIKRFVPLLQDWTSVRREDNGRGAFSGLENGSARLVPAECLYLLNRSDALGDEPGDDYGRSRLENIRDTSWLGWLDTARRLAELEDRISGVVPKWEVPKTEKDADGKTMADYAKAALLDLVHPRSNGVVIENPALGEVNADDSPGRYKQLQSQLEPLDMGNRTPGQAAMLEKLKYLDSKIGEGLYRGARTLFATQGGTKADAQQHTANAEPDCEAIDGMIAGQLSEQVCRVGLTLNFGPDILKKVRGIKAAPIVDQDQQRASATVTAMLANATLAQSLGQTIDVDKLLDQARLPRMPDAKFADIVSQGIAQAQAAKAAQTAALGGPPQNGNGAANLDKRVARGIDRITRRAG
jgi:hypothetical protein